MIQNGMVKPPQTVGFRASEDAYQYRSVGMYDHYAHALLLCSNEYCALRVCESLGGLYARAHSVARETLGDARR